MAIGKRFSLTTDFGLALKFLHRVARGDEVMRQFERNVRAIMDDIAVEVEESLDNPWKKGSAGLARLYKRSGNLADSIRVEVEGPSTGLHGQVAAEINFGDQGWKANLMELGTRSAGGILDDITPKQSDFLWIPQDEILDESGFATSAPGETPTGFTFARKLIFGPNAGGFYGRRQGSRDWVKLWHLTTSVAIPPRPFLAPAAEKLKGSAQTAMARAVRVAIKQ
jgi:hypothetical protein